MPRSPPSSQDPLSPPHIHFDHTHKGRVVRSASTTDASNVLARHRRQSKVERRGGYTGGFDVGVLIVVALSAGGGRGDVIGTVWLLSYVWEGREGRRGEKQKAPAPATHTQHTHAHARTHNHEREGGSALRIHMTNPCPSPTITAGDSGRPGSWRARAPRDRPLDLCTCTCTQTHLT